MRDDCPWGDAEATNASTSSGCESVESAVVVAGETEDAKREALDAAVKRCRDLSFWYRSEGYHDLADELDEDVERTLRFVTACAFSPPARVPRAQIWS